VITKLILLCTAKVKLLFTGAKLFRVKKQNKIAAFKLHQAAEETLLTIFKKATGRHINAYNIDKLFRYCSMINYKISAIFPRIS
jgi:hypothetical protein